MYDLEKIVRTARGNFVKRRNSEMWHERMSDYY